MRRIPRMADDLQKLISQAMLRDQHGLLRRWEAVRRRLDHGARGGGGGHFVGEDELRRQIEESVRRRQLRDNARPKIWFPEELPVSGRREELKAVIDHNQVVVVCGETGSGKTTQLPKICLEMGRGVRGMIGHTQPRRLAARTVAERIAQEVGQPLGEAVGYQVRFTAQVGEQTLVKLMTDGILLAEIQ